MKRCILWWGAIVTVITAAFVVPVASASPLLTQPTGTVLGTSAVITGSNTGEIAWTTSMGTWTCSYGTLSGVIVTNSTSSGMKMGVESMTATGTSTSSECTSWTGGVSWTWNVAGGLPWCLEATSASDEWKLRGGKCSEAYRAIKFSHDYTSMGTCTYERANAAFGTLTTDTAGEAAKISITRQEWLASAGNPFGCPSSGKLNMTFDLTSGGSPVYFSS
jgi:hypothetical protein